MFTFLGSINLDLLVMVPTILLTNMVSDGYIGLVKWTSSLLTLPSEDIVGTANIYQDHP